MSAFDKLTLKQAKFVRHYYLNGNATKAALAAGYSEASAYSIASENLSKPEIRDAMSELEEETKKKYAALEHKIVRELCAIAFFDLTEVMETNEAGSVQFKKNMKDLPKRIRRALLSYNQTFSNFGDSTTFRAHDKLKALDMLGKHIGMFKVGANVSDVPGNSGNSESPVQRIQRITRQRGKRIGSQSTDNSEGVD